MIAEPLLISLRNGVRKIVFNRPEKKNALNGDMYIKIADILNQDANDDKIVVTIITGTGDFYSSGNDISNSAVATMGMDALERPRKLIQAFIDYPKLLIAVVNGPAIGIAATTAALCDIVYASNKAYFHTPFIQLGLCAEGASSYIFPRILGLSKASEMLLLGKKLSAKEAYNFGLVSEVIPHEELDNFTDSLYKYGELPIGTLKANKELIRVNLRKIETDCNAREIATLQKCIESEEFGENLLRFLNKSKL